MTTYRLFPSANGPASAVAYGPANFISGVGFAVKGGGNWFSGYWWWVCPTGGLTAPVKCALWSATSSGGGSVVAGSVVTSGTLSSGWNYIPLAAPVLLAPSYDPSVSTSGSIYVAAVGVNGNFPDTTSYWNSGDTAAAGIVNGPLVAYSGKTGSKPAPYSMGQGFFTTAGSDPSVTFPASNDSSGDGASNFWVDVQVSDAAPLSYGGSYRLWPSKADSNPALQSDAAVNYTVGTEVHLAVACKLSKAWYYSQSGAVSLATRADVWDLSTGLSVASISSPSWSGAAGSGWVSAAFAAGTTLPAGSYIVSVYNGNGTSGAWAPKDASTNYWGQGGSGGVGSSGITQGPLYAPPQPSAALGYNYSAGASGSTPPFTDGTRINAQPPFGQSPGGTLQYPQLYAPVGAGTNQSQNYWVDLEVTPPKAAGTRPSLTAAVTAVMRALKFPGAARAVTAAASASAKVTRHRSVTRAIAVTISASASHSGASHPAGARPSLTAAVAATGTAVRRRISGRAETAGITAVAGVTRHRSASRAIAAAVTARAAVPGGGRGAARPVTAAVTARAAHSTRRAAAAQATASVTARAVRTVPSAPVLPATAPVAVLTAETERTGGPD